MLSHTGEQKACSLGFHLTQEDICHRLAVSLIQVADGFIRKQEAERLYQSPYHGHTLLLSETHAGYLLITLICYSECFKPFLYLSGTSPFRECILDLNVLPCRQFRKQTEFLEHMAEYVSADIHPLAEREGGDVLRVKEDASLIILAIARQLTA